ncbi:CoA transferase [Agreia sp. COWG]|uniref:CoA transferase n=1 Tax=Agreia sp. COWG TaxID=2773266 RepID=UPI001F1DB120|nr:CoA transferase [Agreia sp. COWG]
MPIVSLPDDARLRALLPSSLDVAGLATRSVSAYTDAVDDLLTASKLPVRSWRLDADRIAASYGSDRVLRQHAEPVSMFAELSGFFPAQQGWVRTHANYPHHRERLCAVLDVPPTASRATVAAAIAALPAQHVEDAAFAAGALAVRVRRPDEWRAQPDAVPEYATTALAPGRALRRPAADESAPLSGIRVLDLTRVIAGPVATRALALLGADVLRVDSPNLPEPLLQQVDTGQGKRSAVLDALHEDHRETLDALLETADVLVTGYRPGAIERLGLTLPPGVVHATVTAWGGTPGWNDRRGFDSLVQAATGISVLESRSPAGQPFVPGALPVQALDHSAGYLLASAVIRALAARLDGLADTRVSVSLTGVAGLLLDAERHTAPDARLEPTGDVTVSHGDFTTARPALAEFDDYAWPAHPIGDDKPRWA